MKPTLQELRKLLDVPDLQSSSSISPTDTTAVPKSPRPIWAKPIPKFTAATILLMPVFAVAALFLGSTPSTSNKSRSPEFTEPDSKSESPSETTEIVRQENARLKANAALEGQQRLEKQTTKARPNSKPAPKQSGKPLKAAISRAVAPPSTISIRQSESPRLVTAPVPRSEALPTRPVALKSSHTQAINPAQRWQELAEIGSYGSAPERIAQPESSRSKRPLAPIQTLSSVPEPRSETSHLTVNPAVDRNNLQPDPVLMVDKNSDRPLPISSYPPILQAAEARVLNQDVEVPTTLIVGSNVQGVLVTSIISDEPQTEATRDFIHQATVALSQPLQDDRGKTVLPKDTRLTVQLSNISQSGQVRLSAIAATWIQDGVTRSIQLPSDAIQIRAEDGKPLVANDLEDKGKEIAALDTGQFILGALQQASGQFTQPNTQVQAGNGTTIVTQTNPRPNLIANVLKGGSDSLLNSVSERNRRAVEEIQNRPVTRIIKAGQPVRVFVNQAVQIQT